MSGVLARVDSLQCWKPLDGLSAGFAATLRHDRRVIITRERLLPAGLGLLAVSLVLRLVLPASFDPESRAVVFVDELQHIAFWLGVLCVAAGLLALVLAAPATDDRLAARLALTSDGTVLAVAAGLLVMSTLVRLLVTGVPGQFGRLDAVVGQLGAVCFWFGLMAVGVVLARALIRERTG